MIKQIAYLITLHLSALAYSVALRIESRFTIATRRRIIKFLRFHIRTAVTLSKLRNICIFGSPEGTPTAEQMRRMLNVGRWPFHNHNI